MLLEKCIPVRLLPLLATLVSFCGAFEPLSMGIVGGLGSLGWVGWKNWDFVKDHTLCKFTECCRKPYLKSDIAALKNDLKNSLYGQHIVQDVLVNAIGAHIDNIESSRKPLVMSFHGTSGTGKNFVSDYVAAALYKNGLNSKFVYKFTASSDDKDLAANVKQTVKSCSYSLFIFDEIEKMPEGVFDSLVSLFDHHYSSKGYDFSKAIVIFLSNSAGSEIAKKLKNLMDSGFYREETKLTDFERIAELGAYNVIGGLYRSKLIDSHIIDYFVPFLPLESRHVEMCIVKEFTFHNCPSTTSEDVGKILNEVMTYDDTGKFSNGGCKRLSKKVQTYCYQLRKIHLEMFIKKEIMFHNCPSMSEEDVGKILNEAMTNDNTGKLANSDCKGISEKVQTHCYQLRKIHLEMCIKKEITFHNCPSMSEEDVGKILNEAMTNDDTEKFSNSDCKGISEKVQTICYQLRKTRPSYYSLNKNEL